MRYPGFLRTFGSRLGAGLAEELLDHWFPPPPSFMQRFAQAIVDQAPTIVALVDHYTKKNTVPSNAPNIDDPATWPVVPGTPTGCSVGWAPGCGPLGEFTCPKCGGHTWNTMGPLMSPVVERYCTNGLETAYGPGLNPNTVKEPCMFRWKSTEDRLYFAPPPRPKVRGGSCTDPGGCKEEVQVCAPPGCVPVESHGDKRLHETLECLDRQPCVLMTQGTPPVKVQQKDVKLFRVRSISYGVGYRDLERQSLAADATIDDVMQSDDGGGVEVTAIGHDNKVLARTRFFRPIDESSLGDASKRLRVKSAAERIGLRPGPDANERYRSPLQIAVGDRRQVGESVDDAAARLLAEADTFIKQQADKIADLILDNAYPPGKGEIGFMLSEAAAKKLGLAYAEGAPPIRVWLVLDGWQWSVRLGPGRVGGQLIRVDWAKAEELLRDARPKVDQTEMAQNASGGVA